MPRPQSKKRDNAPLGGQLASFFSRTCAPAEVQTTIASILNDVISAAVDQCENGNLVGDVGDGEFGEFADDDEAEDDEFGEFGEQPAPLPSAPASKKGVRARLHDLAANKKKTKDPVGFLTANAFLRFEQHLREGRSRL